MQGQHGSDGVSLSPAGLAVHLLAENKQIFVIDWRFSCFVFKTRLHFFFFVRVGALPVLGPLRVSVSLRTILSVSVNMLVVVWVGSGLDTEIS